MIAPFDVAPAIAELAQLDQWVISKYVPRRGKRGKLDKPPFSPIIDAMHTEPWMCSPSNPADWSSYDTARAALSRYSFQWLGFVFHETDPYSGIDLDGCRDKESGAIESWAQRIIDQAASYTEISPSETGVKIFGRGAVAEALNHPFGPHKGIEVYSRQRFFTITGRHLAGTPTEIRDIQPTLDALEAEYPPKVKPVSTKIELARSCKAAPTVGRTGLNNVKAQFNAEHPLPQLLTSYGAVQTSSKDYSCPFCMHSHSNTLFIYEDRVFSRSPNCKVPMKRGLDAFGLYVLIDHNNDVVDALKVLNPIEPRRRNSETDSPLPPEPPRRTGAQIADAQRKRDAWTAEASAIRENISRLAEQDNRLKEADRATLRAMLAWAAEHNAVACWLGRAALATRAGYSFGSVKRSLRRLEVLGYFESSGSGGRPIDTARRNFSRGSCLQTETIFAAKDDPRIDLARDLPTLDRELTRGAQPAPEVENYAEDVTTDAAQRNFSRGSCLQTETIFAAKDDPRIDLARDLPTPDLELTRGMQPAPVEEWELWQPYDAECSGWDLELEMQELLPANPVSDQEFEPNVGSNQELPVESINAYATIARLYKRQGRDEDAERVLAEGQSVDTACYSQAVSPAERRVPEGVTTLAISKPAEPAPVVVNLDQLSELPEPDALGASYDPTADRKNRRIKLGPKEATARRKSKRQARWRTMDAPELRREMIILSRRADKTLNPAQRYALKEQVAEMAHYLAIKDARLDLAPATAPPHKLIPAGHPVAVKAVPQ
jgi:hypothetical protein